MAANIKPQQGGRCTETYGTDCIPIHVWLGIIRCAAYIHWEDDVLARVQGGQQNEGIQGCIVLLIHADHHNLPWA